jgi:hypothetical protein
MKDIDIYFDQKAEPVKGSLAALRQFILSYADGVSEVWRYQMPFYCIDGKRFCYLWVDKKRHQPYIGFVDGREMEHSALISEKRSRMKIFIVDPTENWDQDTISLLLDQAINIARLHVG